MSTNHDAKRRIFLPLSDQGNSRFADPRLPQSRPRLCPKKGDKRIAPQNLRMPVRPGRFLYRVSPYQRTVLARPPPWTARRGGRPSQAAGPLGGLGGKRS
jgi:hypothetical protein